MVHAFLFLTGLVLGAALLYWRNAAQARELRRIPKQWPLKSRSLVNSGERRVWIWLVKVMFDHQVLVKLPVTRFTTPTNQQEAAHWYKLLNGVYCTFTVCDIDGRVVGCVDGPGPKGLSLGNQTLKHTLLSQSGIHYCVVDPAHLPQLTQIRAAFLGEQSLNGRQPSPLEERVKNVSENLHAVVTRQRHTKNSQHASIDGVSHGGAGYPDSRLNSGWVQDSFLTPLDSRSAPLGS